MSLLGPSATRVWGRRIFRTAGALGSGYAILDYATDSSLTRSLRTLSAFVQIAWQYKYTEPSTPEELSALHSRAAQLILHICLKNEGLYIKLGQGLNAMSHVLPREYTEELKVLLDKAPPVPISEVRKTIRAETGKEIEELFLRFDETPVASASIAQVHRAWLPPPADGSSTEPQQVAVKVRKPCISTQSVWDLYMYRTIMTLIKLIFDLPTDWSKKTVCDALEREMDLRQEAANAKRFRRAFRDNPRVYIPKVYDAYTSTRLLVLEWIEGTKLNEVEKVRAEYDVKCVLTTLFDAVGDMVFKHGFVHSDPHAANVLLRHLSATESDMVPAGEGQRATGSAGGMKMAIKAIATRIVRKLQHDPGDYQVVLIDFGLVTPERVRFRYQYALLFVSLFTSDMKSLRRVIHDWGIKDAELFASMQAQKPIDAIKAGSYGEITPEEVRALQKRAHDVAKRTLRNTRLIPKELIMVGRSLDILRGVNRLYGSPVNRMNMFVKSAMECLGSLRDYDAVDAYLKRMQAIMRDQGASSAVVIDHYQEYESVYDASADAVRVAQEAAAAQIAAQDALRSQRLGLPGSLHSLHTWFGTLYRMYVLYGALLVLHAAHAFIHVYNAVVASLLPLSAQHTFKARSLEDQLRGLFEQEEMGNGENLGNIIAADAC